jgi:protein-S-isoprenylcysteine O-methyltransferase Ste14
VKLLAWNFVINQAIRILWLVLLVYWLWGAIHTKSTRRRESRVGSTARTLLTVFLFVFLFSPVARIGWLAARFVPRSSIVSWLGVILTAAGIALAIWARHILGRNWSAAVTIKHSHELILGGPYRSIRHPIYSGISLALFGTALAIGEWTALLAFTVALSSWFVKARREEKLLSEEFGAAYNDYCRRTGMFLPRLS